MIEVKSAAFSFDKFSVPHFSYTEAEGDDVELKLNFKPKGIYHENTGVFEVIIEFTATNNSKNVVNVKSVSIFKFDNQISFSDIPNYFYKNSLAIAFPYVRAFVSNLTLQSNTGVIMLGLINFTNMEEFFIKNTIAVSE